MVVTPIDADIARATLLVGMFTQQYEGGDTYERSIPEEGTRVTATIQAEALHLQITPTISMMSHHSDKRIAASVYFEIAAKYAEKVAGKVTQMSNIGACVEDGISAKILAQYPDMPLSFERACIGFQEVLNGGHIHDEEADEPIAYS